MSSEPTRKYPFSTPQQPQVLRRGLSSPLTQGEVAHNLGQPQRISGPQLPFQQTRPYVRV
jgi:hypothetical protein